MWRQLAQAINSTFWSLCSLLLAGIIVVGALYVYLEVHLPNVETLKDMHLQVPLRIYSSDHQLIAEYGTKRRIPVTLSEIPPQLIHAVLATEDARYYEHPGVDFIGLLRAARAVIMTGKKVQGASTITMQVARNFFLSRKKTYTRKINEILLALKIDRDFSKNDILNLYLNKVYLGQRAYGVAAAARVYYGKSLNQLTLAQMAMIAGLPQAPSADNPISNPVGARDRRAHVLQRMLEVGYITHAQYTQAVKQPITASYHREKIALYAPYVAEWVRKYMVKHYGEDAYSEGYSVTTTISSKLQPLAQAALVKGLYQYDAKHGYHATGINWGTPSPATTAEWQQRLQAFHVIHARQAAVVTALQTQSAQVLLADGSSVTIPWSGLQWARQQQVNGHLGPAPTAASDVLKLGDVVWVMQKAQQWVLTQIPTIQGALVAENPNNGAILAMVGGLNFKRSHFNRATQARRQPGSNFKPFIYSAALAKGDTLATLINDAPIVLQDTGENALWRPHNDNNSFDGPTRLRVGLTLSRNLVSIRLLKSIGIPYALKYATRFGFDEKDLPHGLSLALGSATVTPMQIATAYAVFANGGYRVNHFVVNTITKNGAIVYQAKPATVCASTAPCSDTQAARVITAQNAYLMNHAMQDVIKFGTGRRALSLHRSDLAGKTGTTNQQVDAWFSGFNADIVCSVWVGFDDQRSTYAYGSQAALPIWIDFMGQALKGVPENAMAQPPGIVTVRIDPKTGLLANPGQRHSMFEMFRQQYVPKQFAPTQGSESSQAVNDGDVSSGGNSQQPLF